MRRQFLTQGVALAATIAAPSVFAQAGTFPDKPVRIVVAFGPGGSPDVVARMLQPKISALLGQPVIIENKPGGSTSIACNYIRQSPPDGYTLMLTTGGGHASHTIDQPQYGYDPIKDFGPVCTFARASWAFVVHPSVPAKTLTEYIAYARANPNKINYSSSGVGVLNHLAMERFNAAAGIKAVHVPYKDVGASVTDLLSGRIQAAFSSRSLYGPHAESGALRALAYTATAPGEFGPQYTFASAGVPEIDDTDTIYVLLGPLGMPAAAVAKWSAAMEATVKAPELQAAISKSQHYPYFLNPRDTTAKLIAEHDKYLKIIRAANIKMNG